LNYNTTQYYQQLNIFARNKIKPMKRIVTLLTTLLLALYGHCGIPLTLTYQEDAIEGSDDEKNDPNRGHRSSPAPIVCNVDLEGKFINSTSPLLDSIILYELFNEDGSICLLSEDSEGSFIENLTHVQRGGYIVVLKSETFSLFGYINL